MTLTISLPPDAEAELKARALAAGQDIVLYIQQLIARELAAPLSLTEAAEPISRAIDAAGVSDDDLSAALLQARDAARSDRRSSRS